MSNVVHTHRDDSFFSLIGLSALMSSTAATASFPIGTIMMNAGGERQTKFERGSALPHGLNRPEAK